MKRPLIHLILLLILCASPAYAGKHRDVVFEATVVRVEPWGPAKISCGVMIVYRLAEYRVDVVYHGDLHGMKQLTIEHLACNYDELDGLKAGDKVIVVAEALSKPEKHHWMTYPIEENPKETAPASSISVAYRGIKVAKVIYPTAASQSTQ